MTLPRTGAAEWAASQASPWETVNLLARMLDAGACRFLVEDRDLTAAPGSCADGACYLVAASPTGAWSGQAGKLAVAIGANAANGWQFMTVAVEGVQIYVRDENSTIMHDGAAWQVLPTTAYTDEQARDAVGAMIADSGTIDATYNDAGDLLTVEVIQSVLKPTESLVIACSDETTALAIGAGKVTFRMPYAFTLTAVRASLTIAQTSGSILTVDINEGGSSVLSTKLTIDNTEKTSTTAATAAVVSDASLADDAEITIDIDQVGDGTAKGLKVYLIGHRP